MAADSRRVFVQARCQCRFALGWAPPPGLLAATKGRRSDNGSPACGIRSFACSKDGEFAYLSATDQCRTKPPSWQRQHLLRRLRCARYSRRPSAAARGIHRRGMYDRNSRTFARAPRTRVVGRTERGFRPLQLWPTHDLRRNRNRGSAGK